MNQSIDFVPSSFGSNIKRLRSLNHWSQEDLSQATGIKVAHLSRLERDLTSPKLSTIYKIIKAFDCTPNDLLMTADFFDSSSSSIFYIYAEQLSRLDDSDITVLKKIMDSFLTTHYYRKLVDND